MKEITLYSPFDAHLHLRQGELLTKVLPHTTKTFAAALVMPNTFPIISSISAVINYKETIVAESFEPYRETESFRPYMTLYFQPDYTESFLEEAKKHILSIKFYPKNLTTNSNHGCDPDDPKIENVLSNMQYLQIPLCVHAEAPGYHEDREYLFYQYIKNWATRFPKLKIIVEHISCAPFIHLLHNFENVFATITPHHLLLTGDDFIGPPLNIHNFCIPVCKRPDDRDLLQQLVLESSMEIFSKVMLGTDSAPHSLEAKLCGCAGIFNAPIALQLLAELFEDKERKLQQFVSDNACNIYDINLPNKIVTLIKKPFIVSNNYDGIVPMFANETIEWSVI